MGEVKEINVCVWRVGVFPLSVSTAPEEHRTGIKWTDQDCVKWPPPPAASCLAFCQPSLQSCSPKKTPLCQVKTVKRHYSSIPHTSDYLAAETKLTFSPEKY